MSENNKKFELKDEELIKVTGGTGYTIGNPKPIGYAFHTGSISITYKIYEVVRFVNDYYGYEYKVDLYYNDEFAEHYFLTFYDYDIDNFS